MEQSTQSIAHPVSPRLATFAGGSAIAFWSLSGLCYAAGSRFMGAMPYLCVSCLVGVATIILLQLIRRQPLIALFRLPPRVIIAGFLGIAIYSILLASAMGMAEDKDLAHVMLLNYLWPIWIVLLSILLLDEPVHIGLALLGAAIGFAGVVIAHGLDALHHPPRSYLPHAMAAGASLLWALYSVLLRRWRIPSEQGGSTLQFAICAILAGILGLIQHAWHPASLHRQGLLLVALAGIGPVGLAYYWWEIAMKRGHVQFVALLAYFIPIASTALIALVYRKSMSPMLLPGAAMITAGAMLGRFAAAAGGNHR